MVRLTLCLVALAAMAKPIPAFAQYLVADEKGKLEERENLVPVGDRVVLVGTLPDSAKGRTTEVLLYWRSSFTVEEPPPTTRTVGASASGVCEPDLGSYGWENRRLGWTDQTNYTAASDPVYPNKLYRFLVCIERLPTPTESARFAQRAVDSLAAEMGELVQEDRHPAPVDTLAARAVPTLAHRVEELADALETRSARSPTATERVSLARWPPSVALTDPGTGDTGATLRGAYLRFARAHYSLIRATHDATAALPAKVEAATAALMQLHEHPGLRAALHASFLIPNDRKHAPTNAALMEARRPISDLVALNVPPADSTALVRTAGEGPHTTSGAEAAYRDLASGTASLTRSERDRTLSQRLEACDDDVDGTPTTLCIQQLTHTHRDTLTAMRRNVRSTAVELEHLVNLVRRDDVQAALLDAGHLGSKTATPTEISGLVATLAEANAAVREVGTSLERLVEATAAVHTTRTRAIGALQRTHQASARVLQGRHYHARVEPQRLNEADIGLMFPHDVNTLPFLTLHWYPFSALDREGAPSRNRPLPSHCLPGYPGCDWERFKRARPLHRLSLFVGATAASLDGDGQRTGLVGSFGATLGVGYRVGDVLRVNAGILYFRQENPNPLITDDADLAHEWFLGLSLPQSLDTLVGWLKQIVP